MKTKRFKVGERYYSNKGNTTYVITGLGALAAASVRDDLTGKEKFYRIDCNDEEEYIDLSESNPQDITADSSSVIRASRRTDYIAMTNEENDLMYGLESTMTVGQLINFFGKGLVKNNLKLTLKLADVER